MHLPGERRDSQGGVVFTVCTQCKRVLVPSPNPSKLRVSVDDDDQWMNIEDISNTQSVPLVNLSHGLCSSCFRRMDACLESNNNKSTPLSYPLPRKPVPKANSAPALLSSSPSSVSPSSSVSPLRILVVDDNKLQRRIHQRMVEQAGFACDAAESGEQAIEKVKTTTYSLILMDLMMTGNDGWDTSKTIRTMMATRDGGYGSVPKVVAVTGMRIDNQLIKDCAAAGMDDIVHKPVAPAVLNKLLRRYSP